MSLADDLISFLRCPGCAHKDWDLRAEGVDELPRLEGTLCCANCGQAFAARGGVLDMVPGLVEDRRAALRRRLESPPVARFYEESLRPVLTPLASPLRDGARRAWLESRGAGRPVRRVIDFGCGRGGDLEAMRALCEPELAVGVDVSQVLLAEAAREARALKRPNVAFLRANLEDLPLDGVGFGWACCYGVLHRLRRPTDALRVMASLLEAGAPFTGLTTKRLPQKGLMPFGQRLVGALGQLHLFEPLELETMFAEAGLEIDEIAPYGPVVLLSARRGSL